MYLNSFLSHLFRISLNVFADECAFLLASKFMPESTFINWEQQTADEVNRQYRALGDLVSN